MAMLNPISPALSIRAFESPEDLVRWRNLADILLLPQPRRSRYAAGYACSAHGVHEAQRLRYEVFNVELGEGLTASSATGLDADPFDEQMTHLVVIARATGAVAGTYRLQSGRQALENGGFYSATEFDMTPLLPYAGELVELGRACLAAEHRNLDAIMTLWHGIGHFMNLHGLRFLTGCCSLSSTDPDDGWRAMKKLRADGFLHPGLHVRALASHSCGPASRELDPSLETLDRLPKLFRTYMRLGGRVTSEPAIDRDFGTVDFLGFMDGREVALSQLDLLK